MPQLKLLPLKIMCILVIQSPVSFWQCSLGNSSSAKLSLTNEVFTAHGLRGGVAHCRSGPGSCINQYAT